MVDARIAIGAALTLALTGCTEAEEADPGADPSPTITAETTATRTEPTDGSPRPAGSEHSTASTPADRTSETAGRVLFGLDADSGTLVAYDPDRSSVTRTYDVPRGEGLADPEYAGTSGHLFLARTVTGARSEIVRVPVDGGAPTTVAVGRLPAVSHDGERLAFVREPAERPDVLEVVVRTVDDDTERVWTVGSASDPPIAVTSLGWAPDARRLAVSLQFEDGAQVSILDTSEDPGSLEQIATPVPTDDRTMLTAATFRSDGELTVAAVRGEFTSDEQHDVVNVDPTSGEELSSLATDLPRRPTHLDWDVDRARLLVTLTHDHTTATSPGPPEVWSVAAGRSPQRLAVGLRSAEW